jgi:hypothetical protein
MVEAAGVEDFRILRLLQLADSSNAMKCSKCHFAGVIVHGEQTASRLVEDTFPFRREEDLAPLCP